MGTFKLKNGGRLKSKRFRIKHPKTRHFNKIYLKRSLKLRGGATTNGNDISETLNKIRNEGLHKEFIAVSEKVRLAGVTLSQIDPNRTPPLSDDEKRKAGVNLINAYDQIKTLLATGNSAGGVNAAGGVALNGAGAAGGAGAANGGAGANATPVDVPVKYVVCLNYQEINPMDTAHVKSKKQLSNSLYLSENGTNKLLVIYNENVDQFIDKNDISIGGGNGVCRKYRSDAEKVITERENKPIVLGFPTMMHSSNNPPTKEDDNVKLTKNMNDAVQQIINEVKKHNPTIIVYSGDKTCNLGFGVGGNLPDLIKDQIHTIFQQIKELNGYKLVSYNYNMDNTVDIPPISETEFRQLLHLPANAEAEAAAAEAAAAEAAAAEAAAAEAAAAEAAAAEAAAAEAAAAEAAAAEAAAAEAAAAEAAAAEAAAKTAAAAAPFAVNTANAPVKGTANTPEVAGGGAANATVKKAATNNEEKKPLNGKSVFLKAIEPNKT
jgi:hypothetical protein